MYRAYEIDSLNRQTQIILHAISNAQDGALVARLSKAVLAMYDALYWFQGFRTCLGKMKPSVQTPLAPKIITACEKVQADLRLFRDSLDGVGDASLDVVQRCVDAQESAALLYNELELLRWDAMELQADADVSAGRVTGPFTSVDRLMDSLMH